MARIFHHWLSTRKLLLFFTESLAIGSCSFLGMLLGSALFSPSTARRALWPSTLPLALLCLGWVLTLQVALYLLDLYDLPTARADRASGGRLLEGVALAAMAMGVVLLGLRAALPEGAVLGGALGALLGVALVRSASRSVLGEPDRVAIYGSGAKARALLESLTRVEDGTFVVLAMPEQPASEAEPLARRAARLRATDLVFAPDESRGSVTTEELVRCRFAGIRVHEPAGFCERMLRKIPVAHLRASALAYSNELTVSTSRRFVKRAFDLLMACVLLALASPLMMLIALAIKLDSQGPIFYRQERVGRFGRPYFLWKFRSMRTDAEAEGAVWARAHDDRVTRLGRLLRKCRMDELPQVFNVLLGDMSFVGPRPERPVFVAQLVREIPFYSLREGVKPGITGWAQIRYPYGASVEDARKKLELDLYYVKNGSLFLDLAIIFHTVRHVLQGRGAR